MTTSYGDEFGQFVNDMHAYIAGKALGTLEAAGLDPQPLMVGGNYTPSMLIRVGDDEWVEIRVVARRTPGGAA